MLIVTLYYLHNGFRDQRINLMHIKEQNLFHKLSLKKRHKNVSSQCKNLNCNLTFIQ